LQDFAFNVTLNSFSLEKSPSSYFIFPVIVLGKVESSALNFKFIELSGASEYATSTSEGKSTIVIY